MYGGSSVGASAFCLSKVGVVAVSVNAAVAVARARNMEHFVSEWL
jgi:hypothetical protein